MSDSRAISDRRGTRLPFFALSNHIGQKAFGMEHYVLMAGEKGPEDPLNGHAWEADLFAGL